MSNEDRNAKVVITADTKQYNQSVQQSAVETGKLEKAINGLATKMDGLLKRTGKKMILIGSADLAALTAASTVAATLEKQMSDMEAAAVNMKGALDMSSVKDNIRSLSREFPIARGEIVQLETAITQMGLSATNQVNSMTRAFIQLGGATGESNVALAQGQIGLSRQMGTMTTNPQTMARQNDATTALNAQGGVAATDILSFSQSIAPTAAMSGMTENQVKGVSTAFQRAGANGTYAANVFSQITNDLVRLQETGSPEIQRYANVLGVGNKEIQKMNPVDVLERLTQQTAAGGNMRTLDYLGVDSVRAQKALQGLANEGGPQKWVDVANEAYGNKKNETEEASKKAFEGFFDSMEQLRNRFTDFAQAVGDPILKPLTLMAQGLNTVMGFFQPFIDFISKVASYGGAAGGLGMIGGGLALKSWAGISTPIIGKRIASSTFGEAMRFGLSHGSMRAGGLIPNDPNITSRMVPGTPGGFGMINRGVYRAAGHIGGLFPGVYDPATGSRVGFGNRLRTAVNMGLMGVGHQLRDGPLGMHGLAGHYDAGTRASGYERIGGTSGRGFWSSLGSAARHGGVHEVIGDRPNKPIVPQSTNIAQAKAAAGPFEAMRIKMAEIMGALRASIDRAIASLSQFAKSLNAAAGASSTSRTAARHAGRGGEEAVASKSLQAFVASLVDATELQVVHNKTVAQAIGVQATETKATEASNREVAASMPIWKMLRKQMAETGVSFFELAAAATRAARSMAGTAAGAGLNAAGKGAKGLLTGAAGLMGAHPGLVAAGVAAYMGYKAFKGNQALDDRLSEMAASAVESSNGLRVYNEALGLSTDALIGFAGAVKAAPPTSMKEALDPAALKVAAQNASEYTNPNVETMTKESAIAWVKSQGQLSPEQARAIGTDLQKKFPGDSQVLDALQNLATEKGGKYNDSGYEKSWTGLSKIDTALDVPEVSRWDTWWKETDMSGYMDNLLAEGSPIRGIIDTTFQQAAGNVDWVAQNITTGKGAKADAVMNQATAINEYSSTIASALKGVKNIGPDATGGNANYTDKENAAAIGSITKTLELLGVGTEEAKAIVDKEDITNQDFSGMSEEERKKWVWDRVISPNVDTNIGSYEEMAAKAAGPYSSKREFTVQTEQTMKDITKVNEGFGKFAKQFGDTGLFARLAVNPENANLGTKSIEALKEIAKNTSGKNFGKQEAMLRTLGDSDAMMQPFTEAAIAENRAQRARELTGTNQAVQGKALLTDLTGATAGLSDKPGSHQALKDAKAAGEDWIASWYAKLKDYHKMMAREEVDYQISRARTENDYNRQVAYSTEDFYRGQRYQKQDFHRSMLRQEEDYQIQLNRMVEDASRTMYDPWSRVMAQGTRSGGSEIFNLQEQNELMRDQRKGIDKLKKMGLSRKAIDDLGLMDPGKAQQVDSWADGGISKKEIAKLNREIEERRKNAKSLTITDDNQGYRRQEEDRKRMIQRSVEDFHRGLRRSTAEFLRQMKRGEEEYQRSLRRMDRDRERNLERAKRDMLGFIKDSQKSYEKQAEYVTKILGRMHNRVADSMINLVDKMVIAIDKANAGIKNVGKGGVKDAINDFSDARETYKDKKAHPTPLGQKPLSEMTEEEKNRWIVENYGPWPNNGTPPATPSSSNPKHGKTGDDHRSQWRPNSPRSQREDFPTVYDSQEEYARRIKRQYMKDHPNADYDPTLAYRYSIGMDKTHHVRGRNTSYSEARNAMNVHNNNTNFNGEIKIEAQDPNEMARKLKHKARMAALRGGGEKTVNV